MKRAPLLRPLTAEEGEALDKVLASAFRDLEPKIMNLRNMTFLMETAADDTLNLGGHCYYAAEIHKRMGFDDFHIHVLTEEQSEGLIYALHHLGDLARDLYRCWRATLDESDPRRTKVAA